MLASIRSAAAMIVVLFSLSISAQNSSVSYQFQPPIVPGIPPSGTWSDVENWSPVICLQYDDEGACIEKGFPGQGQPADATEHVFYEVSFTADSLYGPATMDFNVNAGDIGGITVGTIFDINGQLGLQRYEVPPSYPLVWKDATLENNSQVNLYNRIYSNGYLEILGPGTLSMLGGKIEADNLNLATRIDGLGLIQRIGAAGVIPRFSNSGVIDADFSGAPLTIEFPTVNSNFNVGRMEASDGGILQLKGNSYVLPSAIINNSGGTIEAGDGSKVELFSIDLRHGTLATSGTGRIEATGPLSLDAVTNTGLLNINNGQILSLASSIVNDGTIRLDSTSSTTELRLDGTPSNFALDGQGVLELTHATRSVIRPYGSGLINGPEHTIRGTGKFENIGLLDNRGVIDADVAANPLKVAMASYPGALANTGVLRARNGATLDIVGPAWNALTVFNNTTGVIEAQADSVVQLTYVTLTGGTLTTSGNGVIRFPTSASAFGNLSNLGTVDILSSATLLGGTVGNAGNIRLGAGSAGASLSIKSAVMLAGDGTLTLSNSSSNQVSAWGGTGNVLTNGSGHTIQGAGSIGAYGLQVINQGLIHANQSNPLRFEEFGSAQLTNDGTLRAGPGSTLQVDQSLTNFNATTRTLTGGRYEALGTMRLAVTGGIANNAAAVVLDGMASRLYNGASGTVDALSGFVSNQASGHFEIRNGRNFALGVFANAGTTRVGSGSTLTATTYTQTGGLTDIDGTMLVLGNFALEGGQLTGTGTVHADLINNGNLSPGNSPGTLDITGNYTQTSGTLTMELGALVFDRLLVSGAATLGGTLAVDLWSAPGDAPFLPSPGSWFDILEAESISGTFGTLLLPTVPGISWDLAYMTDAIGSTDLLRLTASASPVPLPPAVWMFGSAFAAVVLRRRRVGAPSMATY